MIFGVIEFIYVCLKIKKIENLLKKIVKDGCQRENGSKFIKIGKLFKIRETKVEET